MKYMGGKTWLLANGLAREIDQVLRPCTTFVDLFAGSGAVAQHVATGYDNRVEAYDTQHFAVALNRAVVGRRKPVDAESLVAEWVVPVRSRLARSQAVRRSRALLGGDLTRNQVLGMRELAGGSERLFVGSYGGHYLSVEQSWALDSLRSSLPGDPENAAVALAALVMATSRCSASPGHTAQPFQPTPTALPHIQHCWERDLLSVTADFVRSLAGRTSRCDGHTAVGDANDRARRLSGGEVVFLDPPYSAAQYSRFYHVLEAVAVGGFKHVSGAGRSPAASERHSSDYSRVTTAATRLSELVAELGRKRCTVILTFPAYKTSNGVSGQRVLDEAGELFAIKVNHGASRFSTLGGNGVNRAARHSATEMIAVLRPR